MFDSGSRRRRLPAGLHAVVVLLACVGLIAAAPATAQAASPVLQRIKEAGAIRIAHRESSVPFSFVADGKPVGYACALPMRCGPR